MSAVLKPCPFCGDGRAYESCNRGCISFVCAKCATQGAWGATLDDAIAAWNRRPAPQGPLVGCGDGETRIALEPPVIRKSRTTAAPQVALTDALPELPTPSARMYMLNGYRRASVSAGPGEALFATDQMHAYARQYAQQCIEARNQQGDAGALEMACVVNKKLGDVLAGRLYLLPHDLAALKRFYECATDFDSGGHDVSKDAMARLREIGVVQSKGFGRHETTSFGDYVLARDEGDPVKLPLKTLTERNADAAIEQRNAGKKGGA